MLDRSKLIPRLRTSAWHLAISALVAAVAATLVFGLWYPGQYRLLSGGQGLFFLVVSVDVVLGPLLTFVAFNPAKGWTHLKRDLSIIAVLQLAGLAYGLHTVYVVRPVALVYETGRFRVVSAAEIKVDELPDAPPGHRQLPLTGPWQLAVRLAEPGDERKEAIMLSLQGIDTSQRPSFWRPYDLVKKTAAAEGRPMSMVYERYPQRKAELSSALKEAGVTDADARIHPVRARGDWVAVLDAKGDIVTFLPVDGFF